LTAASIRDRITNRTKPKKLTTYNLWKEAVLAQYPSVFFPSLSPKKSKILKAIEALATEQGVDIKELFEWIVLGWPSLSSRTGIGVFKNYAYPELDLVLYNYSVLINLYISRPQLVKVEPKKKVNLSKFLNDS
jgi:hypothetical protein